MTTLPAFFPDLDSLTELDSPADLEGKLQEAIATHEEPSEKAELLAHLARVQGIQGKREEGHLTLASASALLETKGEELDEASRRAKIRCLLEAGRLSVLDRTPSQAKPVLLKAWTLAKEMGEDFHAIDAAQMLAAIEPQKLQKDWIVKALNMAQGSTHPRVKRWLSSLYSSLGWNQVEQRQFEDALASFKKAVSSFEGESGSKKALVAKWAVAKTLRSLNRFEEALAMQQEVLQQLNIANRKDGYVYEELAECLQSLKKTNEAQVYFDLAYHELMKDEWLTDNKPDRIKRMKSLGKSK